MLVPVALEARRVVGSIPLGLLGLALGVGSAIIWGSADFAGGVATRRANPFQILTLISLAGCAAMILLAILTGGGRPANPDLAFAVAAGVSGAFGVTALYQGLAMRAAAIVAPTATVVGTVTAVLAGLLLHGLPTGSQWLGFGVGAAGIWLVARSPGTAASARNRSLLLATVSGVFIGGFLILLAQVKAESVFGPLAVSKATGAVVGVLVLLILRVPSPSFRSHPLALVAGILDAGGNVLFVLSSRLIRLDVAAVLSSMAPAVTVLLSRWIFKENVSGTQWAGVILCLLAVVLLAA
jgi:drug/metabolite transporter (DMT)-like permease